ncbi:MAG TPA: hypothetical protein VGR00_01690 [Thermoanaerobaculia bacterium]|jgi:hypothetical protein|nr:hypothetical protein [Thermoanaerobaculia bacterium]
MTYATDAPPLTAPTWDPRVTIDRIRRTDDLPGLSRRSLLFILAGSAAFGLALGSYAGGFWQVVASAVKVPLLLLGTAFLSFPTYFVLQMLRGSRPLTLDAAVALQLSSLSATAVLWGSFAPPLLFLVGSTHHYRLAQFFSLAIGAIGGMVGLARFLKLHRELVEPDRILRGHLLLYFVLFSAVGGQLAWVLRPFIGDPGLPFQLFRTLGGDMFTHVLRLLFG